MALLVLIIVVGCRFRLRLGGLGGLADCCHLVLALALRLGGLAKYCRLVITLVLLLKTHLLTVWALAV